MKVQASKNLRYNFLSFIDLFHVKLRVDQKKILMFTQYILVKNSRKKKHEFVSFLTFEKLLSEQSSVFLLLIKDQQTGVVSPYIKLAGSEQTAWQLSNLNDRQLMDRDV